MSLTPKESSWAQCREERFQELKYRLGPKYIEPITKDPEELLKLALIPFHRLKCLKEKLGPVSPAQSRSIRQILNIPSLRPFMRCRGKNRKFIQRCEARGDSSHSGKKHWCDECQCRRKAGRGTKGNFYGLGPETGHLGVGYCRWCEQYAHGKHTPMTVSQALRVARR